MCNCISATKGMRKQSNSKDVKVEQEPNKIIIPRRISHMSRRCITCKQILDFIHFQKVAYKSKFDDTVLFKSVNSYMPRPYLTPQMRPLPVRALPPALASQALPLVLRLWWKSSCLALFDLSTGPLLERKGGEESGGKGRGRREREEFRPYEHIRMRGRIENVALVGKW